MPGKDVISRREHELEMNRLGRTIERLNAELSALAAYLITAKPMPKRHDSERAARLAAQIGCLTRQEAADSIRRIHDAVVLSGHPG
jgi:hypothetical protein